MKLETLADNWSLEIISYLIRGVVDPTQTEYWISCDDDDKKLKQKEITFGAIAIQALASFLELLVFSDKIFVMRGWKHAWHKSLKELDELYNQNVIQEYWDESDELPEKISYYSKTLTSKEYVHQEIKRADEDFKIGKRTNVGTIVNGIAPYLAISDHASIFYCPHPLRSKYMRDELYLERRFPTKGVFKLENLINTPKLNIVKRETEYTKTLSLSTRMSSTTLFCLLESSQNLNPIQVACQLREDESFKDLKAELREIDLAFKTNTEKYVKHCKRLDLAIRHAEKRLGLRGLGEEDGFSRVTICGLPVKVPEMLRRPLKEPRHGSVIYYLMASQRKEIAEALDKFGLWNPKIVNDIINFTKTISLE